jgi:membrane associated rhomboid family serine protease
MFRRQTSGSILCPSCGLLVGVNDEQCLNCGRRRPGLWGFTGPLALLRSEEGFVQFVLWTCGIVYALTLLADPSGIDFTPSLGFLSPGDVIERFGIAGAIPVYLRGRWWTVLSAGWLHGSLVHLGFNMMAVRNLGPGVTHLYGTARTILIYVISCATGFLASSTAGYFLFGLPWPVPGAPYTLGASASIFGFFGAILYYGRRGGSSAIRNQALQWIGFSMLIGFYPGMNIDNWAHLGGLAGGYLASVWLDPLKPERGDHAILAMVALALSLGSVVLSLLVIR